MRPVRRLIRTSLLGVGTAGWLAAAAVAGSAGPPVPVANPDDLQHEPQLERPAGKPPGDLVKYDFVRGDGARVRRGDLVTVQYVGISWSKGKEIDSSWDRGQPFALRLGKKQVIEGWERGIPGMRVGGRRELVIPPRLAYGSAGVPPTIGRNETLVFVIDVVGSKPGYRPCAAPGGRPVVSRLRALRTTCTVARSVARHIADAPRRDGYRGYACTRSRSGQRTEVRCKDGARRVTFVTAS